MNTAIDAFDGDRASTGRRWRLLAAISALLLVETAIAQGAASAPEAAAAPAPSGKISVDVLKGSWVRPDGGYRIEIRSIDSNGRLEATYFNPKPLPFAKAQALPEGSVLRAFFELQAGGYGGSTYELTYDPASDRLKGIYYQAVVKQKFDVSFSRK